MRLKLTISFLFIAVAICVSQNSIDQIIEQNKDKSFYHICDEFDKYFKDKHPDLSPSELCEGIHRDGEYVKYKRWQHFWKSRLESDGTLANIFKYKKKAENGYHTNHKSNSILDNFEWNNISYKEASFGMGRTNALAFHPTDPDIFYVGAAIGGIWKTTDGGQTYIPLGDDLPFLAISSIVVDQKNPNNIYIAISDRLWFGPPSIGVYKSIDAGLTWSQTSLNFKFEDHTRVYWMEADPNNPEVMMVATSNGLFRTANSFDSYDKVTDGNVSDVKFVPGQSNRVYCVVNGVGSGFYKSEDNGETFFKTKTTAGINKRILVTPLDTNKVSLTFGRIIFSSIDGGETFESLINVIEDRERDGILMYSPQNDEHLFAGFLNLFKSENSGGAFNKLSPWSTQSNTNNIHVDQRNAFINPLQDELIYLCNDGGVYTFNVLTDEFTNLSTGLQITQFYDIGISQNDASLTTGGSQDNGNVLLEDGIWRRTAGGDGMMQAFDPVNDNLRYSAIQNGRIYKFDNGIQSRISQNIPDDAEDNGEWVTPVKTDPIRPNVIYSAYEKVYSSNNKGETWTAISDQLANGNRLDYLYIAPSNSDRVYAIENFNPRTSDMYGSQHNGSTLYRKETDSNTWTDIELPIGSNVEDMAIHPDNMDHLYISCGSYKEGEKVYRSYDGGTTWDNISGNLPNLPATAIAYYKDDEDYIFVGTDNGMYYSKANEIDWKVMGVFPNTYITEIEIQNEARIIRASTFGRGIFEGSLELNVLSTKENPQPEACITAYPNPVRDIINIDIQQNDFIEIFNTNGQLIQKINQSKTNVSILPQGDYYILKTDIVNKKRCTIKISKI